MKYPPRYQEIVKTLLAGKFIIDTDENAPFSEIRAHEAFYQNFFKATFNCSLEGGSDGFYYLTSGQTQETLSRDFLLFFSVLAYEYQTREKDIGEEAKERTFSIEEVIQAIEHSSQKKFLRNTKVYVTRDKKKKLDVKAFLDKWERRNLIHYIDRGTKFRFTKAIKLFIDAALDLYKESIASED